MRITGKKLRLKKSIRRTLLALECTITLAGIAWMAIVMFLWALGIEVLG